MTCTYLYSVPGFSRRPIRGLTERRKVQERELSELSGEYSALCWSPACVEF